MYRATLSVRERDKTPAVGRWLFVGNQQMQVIRHEAVRSNCESFIACCTQNMRTHGVHAHGLNERLMPVNRAVRQKIRVFTEVVEALETFGSSGQHASLEASDGPGAVRLKADTTSRSA